VTCGKESDDFTPGMDGNWENGRGKDEAGICGKGYRGLCLFVLRCEAK
jgi:hypothetical protein